MAVSERITELMFFLKSNQKELAEDINFSRQSLNNVLTGNTKFPKVDLIEAILVKYPNLNARWLITGEGKMWMDEKTATLNLEKLNKRIDFIEEQIHQIFEKMNPKAN